MSVLRRLEPESSLCALTCLFGGELGDGRKDAESVTAEEDDVFGMACNLGLMLHRDISNDDIFNENNCITNREVEENKLE